MAAAGFISIGIARAAVLSIARRIAATIATGIVAAARTATIAAGIAAIAGRLLAARGLAAAGLLSSSMARAMAFCASLALRLVA